MAVGKRTDIEARQGGLGALGCGWYETLPPPPPRDALQGTLQSDFVVVGAGFTGLACARRLAELFPSASIVVLEAERVGVANSGRNSGFLLNISFYADVAPQVQARKTRLQRGGLRELERVVDEHRIDCDWHPWGSLHGAMTDEEDRHLSELGDRFSGAGEAMEDWPGSKIAEATGSKRFQRGLLHRGAVLVQPVKLVRGLADSLPETVRIFEDSPIRSLKRNDGQIEVETAQGLARARRAFVCANGGAPRLGFGRRRLVRVFTFAAMTRPLTAADGEVGRTGAFGLLPAHTGGPTLRKTNDNRLVIRQDFAFVPEGSPSDAAYRRFAAGAQQALRLRWPELADIALDHVWGGAMSLTRNTAQIFGEIEPDIFVSAFCNGAGNTSGTMAGRLLAELSAGETSGLLSDQLSLPEPEWVPPDVLLRLFVNRRIFAAQRRAAQIYKNIGDASS